jgi:hypothetical protein
VSSGTSAGSGADSAFMNVISHVNGVVLVRMTRTSPMFGSASSAALTCASVASNGSSAVVWPANVSVNVPAVPPCETRWISGPES